MARARAPSPELEAGIDGQLSAEAIPFAPGLFCNSNDDFFSFSSSCLDGSTSEFKFAISVIMVVWNIDRHHIPSHDGTFCENLGVVSWETEVPIGGFDARDRDVSEWQLSSQAVLQPRPSAR